MKSAAAIFTALMLTVSATQTLAQSPEPASNEAVTGTEPRSQAEDQGEILSFVQALPEAVRQVAVLSGPSETNVRFIMIRMDEHDRLFVHERDGDATKIFFEVAEVAATSERILDIRSELDSTGVVAFIDAAAQGGAETTYELFLDKAAPGTYTFHATSN